jgi:hypothetical protein
MPGEDEEQLGGGDHRQRNGQRARDSMSSDPDTGIQCLFNDSRLVAEQMKGYFPYFAHMAGLTSGVLRMYHGKKFLEV